MRSPLFKSLTHHLILALSILLLFLLIFDPYLQIPDFILFAGRLHPLILHFPIVLLILTVINSFTRTRYEQHILLPITVLVSLFTAITGFLLSEENGAQGDIVIWHQWMGSSVALIAAVWYGLEEIKFNNKNNILIALRAIILLLIISTGHYGGMVTHGRDFLSWKSKKSGTGPVVPADPLIFDHMVLPVLESKCTSCHNEDKSKGGLILRNYQAILRGGKSGPSAIPGETGRSEMIRRIRLPLPDDDHMPPEDHEQLAESEIRLLEGWIDRGMLKDMKVSAIGLEDPFYPTIREFIPEGKPSEKWKDLPEVEESLINRLSSDYCTIRRMAENSNALSVMIFPNPAYSAQRLDHLQTIADNIVELDLSFLPLKEDEMIFISGCHALEWLEIDFTPVDDDQFNQMGNLDNLRILKAQGSGLTAKSMAKLMDLKGLEKLFVWDTGIPDDKIKEMKNSVPGLQINTGIDHQILFTSTLPAPELSPRQTFFVEPLEVKFTHPLKEINIFYSRDGSDPAIRGELYSGPIMIEKSGKLKFMASKEGWEPSEVDSVLFFKTYRHPNQIRLVDPPDPKYSGRGAAGLFDLKKGTFNLQDSAWLGFQEKSMELHCTWEEAVTFKSILLSSFVNPGIHVFPPTRIEVRGGMDGKEEMLGILLPPALHEKEASGFRYFDCSLKAIPVTQLSILVTPLAALPSWHEAKGKPGWFFVDEVVLEK